MFWFVVRRLRSALVSLAFVTVFGLLLAIALPSETTSSERALPLFFNATPRDLESEVVEALESPERIAAAELAGLRERGTALIPVIVPRIGALAPTGRDRALALLHPYLARFAEPGEIHPGVDEAELWARVFERRSLELRPAFPRRLVERYMTERAEMSAVEPYGTLILPALFEAIRATREGESLSRLLVLAEHTVPDSAPPRDSSAPISTRRARWLDWWSRERSRYTVFRLDERAFAPVRETQYGRYVTRLATGELGVSVRDGEPIDRKLARLLPDTLGRALLALLFALGIAIPGATLAGANAGRPTDRVTSNLGAILIAIPAVALASVAARFATSPMLRAVLATGILAFPTMALLFRHHRSATLTVLRSDYVRTARAKGLRMRTVLSRHVARTTVLSTLALAGSDLPVLLGASVVVEHVFGLRGLGGELVTALRAHDVPFVLGALVVGAIVAVLALVVTDVLGAIADPRIRSSDRVQIAS